MQIAPPTLDVTCNLANPGQYFACCGLLELADRLWGGAEGWFESPVFRLRPAAPRVTVSVEDLITAIASARLKQIDQEDDYSSPVAISDPFHHLYLDWWQDERSGGKALKVWAGSMRSVRIARAMQAVLNRSEFKTGTLLDVGMVVYDPAEPDKKVEPFYFDARRGAAAQPIDIGFSPDAVQMTSIAYPAVEFLCLVGLQRFRPWESAVRVFDYFAWTTPLIPSAASAAACGLLRAHASQGFRFENGFRTDQRKHKAFSYATSIQREEM